MEIKKTKYSNIISISQSISDFVLEIAERINLCWRNKRMYQIMLQKFQSVSDCMAEITECIRLLIIIVFVFNLCFS